MMSNQPRAELLAAMAELCARYPDWRFGQLISNVAGWADQEIWDVEDKQLLQAAPLHLQQRAPETNSPARSTKNSKAPSQRRAR
jgi:hypothetical protein